MLSEADRQLFADATARQRRPEPHMNHLAQAILKQKSWNSMGDHERTICIRYLVRTSGSEAEFNRRLREELKCSNAQVLWQEPEGELGNEARLIVQAIGGLVSSSGAMVMMLAYRPDGSLFQA